MQTNELSIYDTWDSEPLPSLTSTQFYPLPVQGVGTPLAEQFSCFWVRLARAHNVQPGQLVDYVIKTRINELPEESDANTSGSFRSRAQHFNGAGTVARRWIRYGE